MDAAILKVVKSTDLEMRTETCQPSINRQLIILKLCKCSSDTGSSRRSTASNQAYEHQWIIGHLITQLKGPLTLTRPLSPPMQIGTPMIPYLKRWDRKHQCPSTSQRSVSFGLKCKSHRLQY